MKRSAQGGTRTRQQRSHAKRQNSIPRGKSGISANHGHQRRPKSTVERSNVAKDSIRTRRPATATSRNQAKSPADLLPLAMAASLAGVSVRVLLVELLLGQLVGSQRSVGIYVSPAVVRSYLEQAGR